MMARLHRIDFRQMTSRLLLAVLMVGTIASTACKKSASNYELDDELARLSAYRQIHYPSSKEDSNGAFHQTLASTSGQAISSGQWLYFDFAAYDLNGALLSTTQAHVAKGNGMYDRTVHYVPGYVKVDEREWGSSMFKVLTAARVGDSIVMGLPSTALGSKQLWGRSSYRSALCYMVLREAVVNPKAHELDRIREYMKTHAGFQARDSVYVHTVASGNGANIAADTYIWVRYSCYFLDGTLLETNSDEVAQQHDVYSPSGNKYNLVGLNAKDASSKIRGIRNVLVGQKVGCRVQLLVPSEVAYGEKGNAKVRPYEPLLYDITVVRSNTKK